MWQNTDCFEVIPWGRISPLRQDIQDSAIPKSEGGSGLLRCSGTGVREKSKIIQKFD